MTLSQNADLSRAIDAARPRPAPRVWRLDHRGHSYWIKQRERANLRMRLQKAIGAGTFEAELAALRQLRACGAPVPQVLAEGPDYFALTHSGETLERILREQLWDAATRRDIFADAGRALAALHRQEISHGRPSLKGMCWQDGAVTFIDFEYYSEANNTLRGHGRDLVLFVVNAMVVGRGPTPELDAALAAYRAADPGGVWEAARGWCRRLRWVDWLTRPVQLRGEGRALEFKAIPLTIRAFDSA